MLKAITGANRDVKRDRLREIYFGAGSSTPSSTVTGITKTTPKALVEKKVEKNYYGWELKHVDGMEEAIELRNRIMDQDVVVVVYKEKNETGLIPHLDVEFKTPNTHLDMVQIAQLVEVIKDAKKMLSH